MSREGSTIPDSRFQILDSRFTIHDSRFTIHDYGHEKRRGCCRYHRRSLRRARRILAAMPREPSGSRFSSQRPIEESSVPPTVQPALLREAAASGCTRCLSRFAPDFLGESGPFCPICLGLRGGIALSAPGVFPLPYRLRNRTTPDAMFRALRYASLAGVVRAWNQAA